MNPDKKDPNIHYLLFYSHQKSVDAHKIICETYGENVIAIRTCECWFKRFKNSDFNISGKERSGHPAAVEEDELMER